MAADRADADDHDEGVSELGVALGPDKVRVPRQLLREHLGALGGVVGGVEADEGQNFGDICGLCLAAEGGAAAAMV